jgi:hypothetical protein
MATKLALELLESVNQLEQQNTLLKTDLDDKDKRIKQLELELESTKKLNSKIKSLCTKLKSLNYGLMKFIPSESQSKYEKTAKWLTQTIEEDLETRTSTSPIKDVVVEPVVIPVEPVVTPVEQPPVVEPISSDIECISNVKSNSAFDKLLNGSKSVNWKKTEKNIKDKDGFTLFSTKRRKTNTTSHIKVNEPNKSKSERKKMHAHHDGCCEGYYNEFNDENQVNQISRHRAYFEEPSTPPGYWDTTFPPSLK